MYSIEDRSQVITIGGVEHKLILTTKATKDITKRYGGLEKLGDKLLKNATMEESLGEVIWLIALLANQEILIHNLQHRDEPVSYTHLDVYKRQSQSFPWRNHRY